VIHRPAPPGARAWADPRVMAYLRERNVPTVVVEEPDNDPIPLVRPLYGAAVRSTPPAK
jgi:hypothetical protein